jgi:lysophospholipase L1-like esterase
MTNKLTIAGVLVVAVALMAYTVTATKKKVVFFGDSITQQGVGPHGFVTLIDSLANAEGVKANYEFTGAGVSGNKVYDLYLRMDDDVLSKSPDIVVIYIGVNDVWHKRLTGTGTDYDKFGRFYEAIVKKLRAVNIKPVLCTPAVIGERTDFSNEQDGDLNLYSNWIRNFASKNDIPLVDLRKSFLAYNLENNKANADRGILTVDRVHLNIKGNQLVAAGIWKAISSVQ